MEERIGRETPVVPGRRVADLTDLGATLRRGLATGRSEHGILRVFDGETEFTLDVSTLDLTEGDYDLTATVVDPTEWVVDEAARDTYMTQILEWDISVFDEANIRDLATLKVRINTRKERCMFLSTESSR